MRPPPDPIAAATHPDPYPYYAELVARRPFYRDDVLGLWVATGAGSVEAILSSALCRVRPPGEPVPAHLLGSSVATIFRQLVRMNDGADHCPAKRAVVATLATLDARRIAVRSATWARALADGWVASPAAADVTDFASRLPTYVIASLLGVPADALPRVTTWVDDLAWCLAPGGGAAHLAAGAAAADGLLATFRTVLDDERAGQNDNLLAALARGARRVGRDDPTTIVANGIGFLWQAYEATAGLIGNTLVALAAHDAVRAGARADPALLPAIVAEVLRHDPPIQNTRRFLAADGPVADREGYQGDAILVILAAANRDPAANLDPARFDPARTHRRDFALGAGVHACPGGPIAVTIATAGIAQLLTSGVEPARFVETHTYRPSANARIPLFAEA